MWIAVQFVGYAEFDVASSLVMSGAFRDIVNARLFVNGFERRLGESTTSDDYWHVMRDVSMEFGFPHVRMLLAGTVYEYQKEDANIDHCCVMRIPLFDAGYVNFKYPTESSIRHAIAITSIVDILQRSILSSTKPSISDRVEQWRPERRFDAVISRAFSDLADFVVQAQHLVAPGGQLIAMKGVYPFEEIARVPATHRVAQVLELHVPRLEAKRHLVFVESA